MSDNSKNSNHMNSILPTLLLLVHNMQMRQLATKAQLIGFGLPLSKNLRFIRVYILILTFQKTHQFKNEAGP